MTRLRKGGRCGRSTEAAAGSRSPAVGELGAACWMRHSECIFHLTCRLRCNLRTLLLDCWTTPRGSHVRPLPSTVWICAANAAATVRASDGLICSHGVLHLWYGSGVCWDVVWNRHMERRKISPVNRGPFAEERLPFDSRMN